MLSWKLPQNVVHGHLVTFGPRVKKQMEQHNSMPLAPTSVYEQGWYGNTTNSPMVEFFCRVDPPMQELHSRKLRKTLVYEINAQCSQGDMKTWLRGPPKCNHMLGYQMILWFIDPTFGCRFMSSWKSPQNVVHGHLVTFGPGMKNQME